MAELLIAIASIGKFIAAKRPVEKNLKDCQALSRRFLVASQAFLMAHKALV